MKWLYHIGLTLLCALGAAAMDVAAQEAVTTEAVGNEAVSAYGGEAAEAVAAQADEATEMAGISGVAGTEIAGTEDVAEQKNEETEEGGIDIAGVIFGHVGDSHEWHICTWKGKPIAIYLPVILHSKATGWHIFSSRRIAEGESYEGMAIVLDGLKFKETIMETLPDGGTLKPLDLSITKNVLSMMMSAALLLALVFITSRWYKRHDVMKEAPQGVAAFMEPVLLTVSDMARENIGEEDYRRYTPYLMVAFLFIITNNFLGIVPFFPGGANLTGNIAVTLVLALFTFFAVNLFGNKLYYKDIFNPSVPSVLKPLMAVIEFMSALMKPISLTVRLFANMLAGHVQLLSIVCIIFIMAKYGAVLGGGMTVVSVLFGLFLDVLEILIAFIQAYVFTMLSAVYIGLAHQKE